MRTRLLTVLISSLLLLANLLGESRFKATNRDGYKIAVPGVELAFPEDHGSHPDFKTEWWYITGHLDNKKRDLGFQITFFRSANRDSDAQDLEQVYMAHAAIVDKSTGKFIHEERLNSADWNADAKTGELSAYNGNWYLRMIDSDTETMKTRFSLEGFGALELVLSPAKDKVLFGENGFSKKGNEVGAASYYITFPRLNVSGFFTDSGEKEPLEGVAWMDHEFSSSQLTEEQIGWNWSSIILDDGTEIMAYVMRREDGQADPNSKLTLIDKDGSKTELSSEQFTWDPERSWESQSSTARYPVEYEIRFDSKTIIVRPVTDDQELRGRIGDFVYWEGAGTVFDESGQKIGKAYTELTGYSESLYGKF
ncbi:lipocalin-like domain-containing protein [Pelagicoccus albus]|uniref:Carotenoid 1,2-hydratase n=1 Tax=Pelagicoccus albus TaxID=415222 RepID=A0A7X1B6L2_9BACT|nr:lipocalin-like domain-containing protein [Pelagicoccus albus]MBC2606638.1 carotenoid 1,2-hydratase [Pelagicoccus albus]